MSGGDPASGAAALRTRPYPEVSELLSEFLGRASTDGLAALDQLCDRNPAQADELRRRVRRLQDLGLTGKATQPVLVIGPFRVLCILGQGGMGRVYLGQQTEPVRRLAAIKVMHPDRDAASLLQRFEAERQALAVLDHPGIAHVLEAGATDEGAPWFAMEFVDGRPLTVACDEARLSLRERLELFLQLCDAVTHAHQNGILHRDLKPNNALVTERLGARTVKVIDFGLVKLMGAAQDSFAELTMDGQVLGTPSYMSPEQAGVTERPVDLRTDVYALGVMLYELLVGRLPLQGRSSAGMGEILRLLREVEPAPPSQAVREQPRELAEMRALDPARWSRALRGDLDWIVAKALAKEPAQRYASVSELAADLRRHLHDEPVLAGPPSALYRLERFVRRHRREVAVGALGLLGLLAALVYISVQAVRLAHELDSFDVLARELEVAGLYRRADQDLWPAVPARLDDITAWEHEVQAIQADVPTFERLLSTVRERGRHVNGSLAFDSPRDAYLQDHIESLLGSVAALHAERGPLADVAAREAWARGLRELTIEKPAAQWSEAIASIADPAQCPAYGGLQLQPQLGLVPLARDPDSGLWEFAFPQPGEALPERVGGRWKIANDTCLVFVLLPGGTYAEGAEGLSAHEAGGGLVSLDPFLISRYEMTQGQWLRIAGSNPSRYTWPRNVTHPVEQVNWLDCERTVARLGLKLPTGAQWEYAARAGNPSPWWTGPADDPPPDCGNFADARLLADMGTEGAITKFHERYDDGWATHAPVDTFRPNPFGLHNVMGNVWEWCEDLAYPHAESVPRAGDGLREPLEIDPKLQHRRELRGGSFYSTYALARSTYFQQQPEESVNWVYGLRPARAVERSAP